MFSFPPSPHPGGNGAIVAEFSAALETELTMVDGIDRPADQIETKPDLICTHDLDGRILSVNPDASAALGLPADILCTMTIQSLLPPQYVEEYGLYRAQLLQHGSATGKMRITTMSGERRVWEYRNTLHRGIDGTFVRGVARDVTESEVFQAVRRSEAHFRSIIENISDVIAIIDREHLIGYHSPSVAVVLGYEQNLLVGTSFLALTHPADQEALTTFFSDHIAGNGTSQTIEVRLQHRNGSWRSFEIVARRLAENGKESIVVNARDITDRKLLELQLAQANRITSLGHLAATVAHEFNNVLMGMLPFAELLQRPDASRAMVLKGAAHIASSIERGKRIAMDILRFTQPAEPAPQVVDIGEWWGTFAPEAEAMLGNTINLTGRVPFRGTRILADSSQLSQVLANLIANARDAMPSGGTITVEAIDLEPDAFFTFGVVPHPERFVRISVTDDGPGMPAHVRERIFEPLFTTKRNGGTGLGLAVAHQVLAQNGGHIFVESEIGAGTTFHLFLPIATASDPAGSDMTLTERRRPKAKTLLMIEDEAVIVDGIRDLLATEDIHVDAVNRGGKALDAVALFRPDVVLLDLGLPDMDGGEVYDLLRQAEPLLPVIFATGHGDRRLIHEVIGDSRTRFLQKPFEIAALLAMIAELE